MITRSSCDRARRANESIPSPRHRAKTAPQERSLPGGGHEAEWRLSNLRQSLRVDRLFEAFDDTATAVNSFYQFPIHAFQQALQPEYSTVASENVA